MRYKLLLLIGYVFLFQVSSFAQRPERLHSGEVLQKLEQLNTLGSVLYIAAHPDDENTQLISYFANELHLRTGYLSATRGDGGQNLIGTEIRESLGILRTQELLSARIVDGGQQFFTRANDFGYSKDPAETFNKWDRDQVLSDFVWVIRNFKPDVIVTRFNQEPRTTHGHHTASAILAMEAFNMSADSSAFTDQLNFVEPWQVKKIFWNTSSWFYRRNNLTFDPDSFARTDVGQYNQYLGKSYTEIAAESRSMHKSQGFGRIGSRGSEYEYLEQWAGAEGEGLFDGVDTSWGRIEGGEDAQYHAQEAILNFDPKFPSSILPNLIRARKAVEMISDDFWKAIKLREIDELILAITGTFVEFVADDSEYVPGDSITISMEVVNRSEVDMNLAGVSFSRWSDNFIYDLKLENNQVNAINYGLRLSPRIPVSNPYWLQEEGTEGMYQVTDQEKIGLPENPPVIEAEVTLRVEDEFLKLKFPVVHKTSDRVKGEVYTPLSIVPQVMVDMDAKAIIYADNQPKTIKVNLIAAASSKGELKLETAPGWKTEPEKFDFNMQEKGQEAVFSFKLFPPKNASESTIKAVVRIGNEVFDQGREEIMYDHIATQLWFPKAETKVVRLDLEKRGVRVGYIMGAGDEVPYSLEQIGYKVDLLEKDQVSARNLKPYDAVIVGIRAFNTLDWLSFKNKELFDYAYDGGTVIVQYNTYGTITDDLAPYPLKISRDRVAVEEAEVRFLVKKHEVLNRPNKISNQDFENWVQERGLYFPDEWDDHFEAILSANDPEESPKDGSLLIAKHGKGYYIYSGLSFFRELPAGVPGAFRLLANMISIGKNEKHNDEKN